MGHQSETPRGIGGHRSLLICVKSKHGCSSGMIGWTLIKLKNSPNQIRAGRTHTCFIIAPTYVHTRAIRDYYYVVVTHNIAHTSMCVLPY